MSESTSDDAIASSCGRRSELSGRFSKSAWRISSGHIIVWSTITSSRTRSTARVERERIDTCTRAIRSVCSSTSRSSAYGLRPVFSGLR